MTKIESDVVATQKSAEELFAFLTDFNNFEKLMPSQVTNWTATKDTCNFTISGMAQVGMKIESTTPHSNIHVVSNGGKLPFDFSLDVMLTATSPTTANGQLIFQGDIPIFIKPMVEGPLRNFFNLLAHKMKEI